MPTHITTTLNEHVLCPNHNDAAEKQKQLENEEYKRVQAALFHGVCELTIRKVRFTLCSDCKRDGIQTTGTGT